MKNKRGHLKSYILSIVLLIAIYFLIFGQSIIISGAVENISNIKIEIPTDYSKILPGETLWFTTRILNFENKQRVDVTLKYEILDLKENAVVSRTETVAIETQASFVGKIEIPEETNPGDYNLKVTMTQANGKTSSGEVLFSIKSEENFQSFFIKNKNRLIIILAIIIVVIILLSLKSRIKTFFEKREIKSQISTMIKQKS